MLIRRGFHGKEKKSVEGYTQPYYTQHVEFWAGERSFPHEEMYCMPLAREKNLTIHCEPLN